MDTLPLQGFWGVAGVVLVLGFLIFWRMWLDNSGVWGHARSRQEVEVDALLQRIRDLELSRDELEEENDSIRRGLSHEYESEIKQLKTTNKWRAARMKTLAAELKALKQDFGLQ